MQCEHCQLELTCYILVVLVKVKPLMFSGGGLIKRVLMPSTIEYGNSYGHLLVPTTVLTHSSTTWQEAKERGQNIKINLKIK